MARPKKSQSRDTRQAILDAALELFSARGFFGSSMRELARAVGVRESALYHHFPSKDAIFKELLTQLGPGRISQVVSVDVTGLADALGAKELLTRLMKLVVTTWAIPQEQLLFRVILQEGARLARSNVANPLLGMNKVRDQLTAMFEALSKAGLVRPLDASATALLFMGPMLALRIMHTALVTPDFKALEADTERLAAQLWDFVQPLPAPRKPRSSRP